MNDKTVEPCAARIKKALSIRNMTQTELCAMAQISKSSLSEYLSGKHEPGQYKIFMLSKALNVDPVWLMGLDVPMEMKEEPETKKDSPDELQLTEGDREMLEVFRLIPEEWRKVFLEQGRAFANSLKKD